MTFSGRSGNIFLGNMGLTVSLNIETQTWPLAVCSRASCLLAGHLFHVLWSRDKDLQMVSAGQLLWDTPREPLVWPIMENHNGSALGQCHLLMVSEMTLYRGVPSTELHYAPNTCQQFSSFSFSSAHRNDFRLSEPRQGFCSYIKSLRVPRHFYLSKFKSYPLPSWTPGQEL